MTKYTAKDFENAKFAEHEDGGLATREGEGYYTWEVAGVPLATDKIMARKGWVPVTTKPTIKRSVKEHYLAGESAEFKWGFNTALALLGAEVIPDPEPTNTERLESILAGVWGGFQTPGDLAKWLNDNGITAPNVKGN